VEVAGQIDPGITSSGCDDSGNFTPLQFHEFKNKDTTARYPIYAIPYRYEKG